MLRLAIAQQGDGEPNSDFVLELKKRHVFEFRTTMGILNVPMFLDIQNVGKMVTDGIQ